MLYTSSENCRRKTETVLDLYFVFFSILFFQEDVLEALKVIKPSSEPEIIKALDRFAKKNGCYQKGDEEPIEPHRLTWVDYLFNCLCSNTLL